MRIGISVFACLMGLSCLGQTTAGEDELKKLGTDSVEGWTKGGVISINVAQTSLSNWAAGGQNTLAINSLLNLNANLKRENILWENYLDIGYGSIKQGKNANWWKTDDKIDFTSKYGRKASDKWYYAGLANFRTQMAPGFNYPDDSTKISNLLAPGYLVVALGMDYKASENFTLFISPLTSKMTFVNDQDLADAGAFGVEAAQYDSLGALVTAGENIRSEFGGYLRMFFSRDLMENVDFQTKLDLFSNYLENPGNIDVSWETLLAMKVNRYISATIATHLVYDDDILIGVDSDGDDVIDSSGPRTQFKEVLAIGFSYKF